MDYTPNLSHFVVQDGWALVATPLALLPEINRMIEERLLLGAGSPRPGVEAPATAVTDVADPWTDAQLARFASSASKYNSIGLVARVLDIAAASPDELFSTTALMEVLGEQGVEKSELKMAWTHLTRHLNAHYGDDTWPLHAVWGPERGFATAEVYYGVSLDRAAQWKRVRGAAA
ncbi:MAG: hypothetical protein QOF21_1560 [Actinomycetota bacterium]|jgi:hypothetical protein